ncbi:flagellar basal-body rod protein FlgF [Polymorphum gilvum]|uniref:Flagellar basal-body rod protein FlgF n=1 Tax=Polymorphum gilvum (strain LMG 25793 / CGMCC 1.9160 / SL003B-26A1) TaxID=991905 RepID=F2J4L9_POLGS|nr:flagellar basal-body rod protein FlgF [Polymorphum gilvum]ADZ72271.1 Flagellar basal body rod protein [Polymorphum gilvum SL003B-26A1]
MQSALYVALSAQVSLSNRLETVARNVANMNTAGYRADEIKFAEVLSKAGADPVSFATAGERYISRQHGGLTRTDNPLDVAVEGDGWLAVRTGAGVVYTRDGRMKMDNDGVLRTLNGYDVLDAGGLPILLDREGGMPVIGRDGTVTQGEDVAGALGLFRIDERAKLTRFDNSGVIPDIPAEPIQEFTSSGMVQGYVEGANINPIRELTKLIMITRAFEGATSMIEASDRSQEQAIRDLGEAS